LKPASCARTRRSAIASCCVPRHSGTTGVSGSSSASVPRATAVRATVATKTFVIEAMSKRVST
jgi:hypothetical protein